MTVAKEMINYARSLFDVVSSYRTIDCRNILILGDESTIERNLDEFGHVNGRFQMYGFRKYVGPKLNILLKFIRSRRYNAKPLGRFGYPLRGELNLKEVAIRTGLGKRGKNTIVLNPKYGTRLRFVAVYTNAPLDSPIQLNLPEEESQFCSNCNICIDICPVHALEPFCMPDPSICLSNISPVDEKGRSVLCDMCLFRCPAYSI